MVKTKKLKIVQLFNIAGVAGVICKILDKELKGKYSIKMIVRKEQDYYGFNEVYKKYSANIPGKRTYLYYIYLSLYLFFRRPNIIHIQGFRKGFKLINKFKKYIFYNPYIIYHAHGGDIRHKWIDPDYLKENADQVIVATEDLKTEDEYLFIPNPVDLDLFYPSRFSVYGNEKKALFIRNFLQLVYPYDYMDVAEAFCERKGLELEVIDRMSNVPDGQKEHKDYFTMDKMHGDFIPFKQMGHWYRQHKYFLDFKGLADMKNNGRPIFSKAALEAAACGCIIVQEDLKEYTPAEIFELFDLDGYKHFIDYFSGLYDKLSK
jgi:hypothetical protein